MKQLLRVIICCFIGLWAVTVEAQPTTAPQVSGALESPKLVGSGNYRWMGLKVYEAALWASSSDDKFNAKKFDEHAFALALTYSLSLKGAAIAERSADEIEKLGIGSDAQRKRWLQAMANVFPDVKSDDQLVGVNLPNQGARFFFNGKKIGDISEPEFAKAFFAIWLDSKTSAPSLRTSLFKGLAGEQGAR